MRRLLAVLVLAAALPVAPSVAAPAPLPRPEAVPGRVTLGPVPASQRLLRAYEALAVTPESRELLRTFEPVLATANAGEDTRLAGAAPTPDLDRDGVGDVLMYDMLVWRREVSVEGDTTLALFSGRTGRRLWARSFEDLALPMLFTTTVGDRRPGVVAVQLVGQDFDEFGYRVLALGGDRGDTVYDTTITPADDLGDVHFGGFFDAMPGGGTDILFGRVKGVVTFGVAVDGVWPPGIDRTQVFVLDGRNGAVKPVTDSELAVGGWPAFSVVGDLDGDRRDDFVVFRRGPREANGTATARSVVEGKVIWEVREIPLGWAISVAGTDDSVGSRRPDVLYVTWASGADPPVLDLLPVAKGPSEGIHAVWLDGEGGTLRHTYTDGALITHYWPIRDVDRDGKTDLVSAGLSPRPGRTDMTYALLTKGGTVRRWVRTVSVRTGLPVAANSAVWTEGAGDLDGDGWPDVRYVLSVATSPATSRTVMGYLLQRDGRAFASEDVPLGGTLDGRGTERVAYAARGDRQTFAMRDGRTGRPYWTVAATSRPLGFWAFPLARQRGRCDGVLLVGSGETKEAAGQVWATVLDGATGRVRWSKPLNLRPQAPAVSAPAGPPARCG
ncbi:MAG TPA: VCBS repeat-containing protein [Mycobacteriales bacterium]